MKNKKKQVCFLLAFSLLLTFTGCGKESEQHDASANTLESFESPADTEDSENNSTENSNFNTPIQTAYPVTLTDQLNRKVTIEAEPQTIVSSDYLSTSLLLALNCGERLVGIEANAVSHPVYSFSAPSILNLPNVGTAKDFDLEKCASLNPDLVIVPAKLKDIISSLEELGIKVLAINPENQELLAEAAILLGTAVNHQPAANALLSTTETFLSDLEAQLAEVEKPTIYLSGSNSFLSTAGSGMYQHALIEHAGGTNAAAELTDTYWSNISYEQLLSWDPEYIVLASDASYTVDSVLNDPNLADTSAIKTRQVYQFPNYIESWDLPVPSSILSSLWLASILHPSNYSPEQFHTATISFYETFYRFTPAASYFYPSCDVN